ncbi:outer membrane lipid asymmetry maintenance protein MlaD [Sulfitobacter sp.]|jgi:phospholipid/cholesterol/gamma-HCH transport system substrate-binding protein|uniref:outer membrane lipid asymmetry maintenance protein MlaD n=1 Tax=Sulfitobacter sp. TaxID=1903071 RepID=UPI0030DA7B87|tara:strand:- start:42155 stop:42604 length:450 start_codon:yes stop_codon:yes gene_type:complete
MRDDLPEIMVGGVVLAAALGFMVYAGQAAGIGKSSNSYALKASFRSMEGIDVGTDLRLAGVNIGKVTDLTLNAETYRADTVVSVARGIEIPDDSALVVSSEGLLGGNYMEIVPGGSPFYFSDGDVISDTQGAISLISLLMKFVSGQGSN